MAAIDAFRVFGQPTPLKAETDWRAIKDASLEALGMSKDFRLLAHLAAGGTEARRPAESVRFAQGRGSLADRLFRLVYPRVDDGRGPAQECPELFRRPHGGRRCAATGSAGEQPTARLVQPAPRRDCGGNLTPGEEDAREPPTEALINAAFSAAPQEDLAKLAASDLAAGIDGAQGRSRWRWSQSKACRRRPIPSRCRTCCAACSEIVARHVRVPRGRRRRGRGAEKCAAGGVPGQIRTREDAIRSLDAVSEFFRRSEPSSPVPMFVDRAKRLIARDFLEVLADLAPDSLAEVKQSWGNPARSRAEGIGAKLREQYLRFSCWRCPVAKQSSQKFIARNRAPRVQIEYDVELYGAQKKVQVPFVMGVMSDLSGDSKEPLPSVDERKFLSNRHRQFRRAHEVDEAARRVSVPNTLTGEGNLQVDITFESMDDFSPAAVARKVDCARQAARGPHRSSPISSPTWMARPVPRT